MEPQVTSPRVEEAASARLPRSLSTFLKSVNWAFVLEVALVLIWAVIVAHRYLNFNPEMIPAGREFSSAIQAHHLWTRLTECGLCALWDGSERGGFPAFVDILGSSLHPLVAVTTLTLGVINGAKVSLIAVLGIAGLAQLWLGAELGLKAPVRTWAALMVVAAGHLSGKMELGLFSMLLSMAMVSLTFPAALYLARMRSWRAVVIFGVVLALLAVSGQGYIQAGFLFATPAYLILLWRKGWPLFRRYLLAAGVGLLLAAPFLVPLLHFYPNFFKASDPAFGAGQPFGFYLLNLVVDDWEFSSSTILNKLPYPHLYNIFIGWIPLLLAMLCARYTRRENRKLFFLAASAFIILLVGSTAPLRWFVAMFPGLAALRFAPVIGGIAVPPLLGLAGYGLNGLLNESWPKLSFYVGLNEERPTGRQLNLRWLVLIPLALALWQGYRFAQHWLYLDQRDPGIYDILDSLETDGLAWVQPPFGEHMFIEPAVAQGLKLSPGIMTWHWADRPFPQPLLEANRAGPPPNNTGIITAVGDVPIYHLDSVPYAAVYTLEGVKPCLATGTGGDLTALCDTDQPGLFVLQENQWSGWYAWQDGQQIPLLSGEKRLTVAAPAGVHTYHFRYLPWDVLLGLGLFLAGVAICIVLWLPDDYFSSGRRPAQ